MEETKCACGGNAKDEKLEQILQTYTQNIVKDALSAVRFIKAQYGIVD